jgi:hypothetical protein
VKQIIPIHLAVEDELSEWIVRKALDSRSASYAIRTVQARGGFGGLKKQVPAYNHAAAYVSYLVLTDLDRYPCPPALIADWLCCPKNPKLLLRVAVREVEAWLLGDLSGLSAYLGLRGCRDIPNPELLLDPKLQLLKLAAASPRRKLRDALVVQDRRSGNLYQGPDYNGALAPFVSESWNFNAARQKCQSLDRFFVALATLESPSSLA